MSNAMEVMHVSPKPKHSLGKRVLFIILAGAFTVSVYYLTANILDTYNGENIERLTSFADENEWYWTCVNEALKCDFYFSGNNETAPVFDALNSKDNTKFTYNIESRTIDNVGVLNSNGEASSFIFVDGEQSMSSWNSQFSTYQFKPSGKSPSSIMHETFQGNSADYVNGKCVKVYITNWQVLDNSGNVVDNVEGDSCIVFRTGELPYENEDTSCEEEYDSCDFMFDGQDEVPTYVISANSDEGFTGVVVARDSSLKIGTMNANGRSSAFILGSVDGQEAGEIAMNEYISDFTSHQFKPNGESYPRIMHEVFQSETDAQGKCVKVYFTNYQTLDANRNVIENVETNSPTACVVFQTAVGIF